jgi:predicted transcriptional regulator
MSASISAVKLRAAREAVGISRELAAVKAACSYRSLQDYERGTGVPPTRVLVALVDLYGVAVEDLLDRDVPVAR